MPTINEVWEQAVQVNANLVALHNDLGALTQRATETNDWLEEVRDLTGNGFTSVSSGIAGVHRRQDITNQLLLFMAGQQQAMICNLEKISHNTCLLLNEAARQTTLQGSMAEGLAALKHMFSTAHPDAALVLDRESQQRRQIEACCPPPPWDPPCQYRPCPAPEMIDERRPEPYDPFKAPPTRVRRRDAGRPD